MAHINLANQQQVFGAAFGFREDQRRILDRQNSEACISDGRGTRCRLRSLWQRVCPALLRHALQSICALKLD